MPTTPTAETKPATEMNIWPLRVVLIGLGVACIGGFVYGNTHTEEFRLRYPIFEPWLWNLYLTFSVASVVAACAAWNWRKWGLGLLAAMGIATLFTEFYAMGFTFATLRIPIVLALVWFTAQPHLKRFQ